MVECQMEIKSFVKKDPNLFMGFPIWVTLKVEKMLDENSPIEVISNDILIEIFLWEFISGW